jgi:hypothetical protein
MSLVCGIGGECLPESGGRAARLLFERVDQGVLSPLVQLLQCGERDLGFFVLAACEAEDGLGGAYCGVVEEALVDVPDLLYVQRPEGESPRLGRTTAGNLDAEDLESFEQVEHVAVVDGKGLGWLLAPARAG